MKSEKGITLIALIITIIVMLILVAVTISVALNGGIFNNAKDASDQTKMATEREQLQSLIISKMDVSTSKIPSNLGTIEIGGRTWTVTAEDGIVILTDLQDENNTKTYNMENDLKIKGVSVISSVTGFNNYGVTYAADNNDFCRIEKSGNNLFLHRVRFKNGTLEDNYKKPITLEDYTELIEQYGMEETYALDGFSYNKDGNKVPILFSPSYDTIIYEGSSYTTGTNFDWTEYEATAEIHN